MHPHSPHTSGQCQPQSLRDRGKQVVGYDPGLTTTDAARAMKVLITTGEIISWQNAIGNGACNDRKQLLQAIGELINNCRDVRRNLGTKSSSVRAPFKRILSSMVYSWPEETFQDRTEHGSISDQFYDKTIKPQHILNQCGLSNTVERLKELLETVGLIQYLDVQHEKLLCQAVQAMDSNQRDWETRSKEARMLRKIHGLLMECRMELDGRIASVIEKGELIQNQLARPTDSITQKHTSCDHEQDTSLPRDALPSTARTSSDCQVSGGQGTDMANLGSMICRPLTDSEDRVTPPSLNLELLTIDGECSASTMESMIRGPPALAVLASNSRLDPRVTHASQWETSHERSHTRILTAVPELYPGYYRPWQHRQQFGHTQHSCRVQNHSTFEASQLQHYPGRSERLNAAGRNHYITGGSKDSVPISGRNVSKEVCEDYYVQALINRWILSCVVSDSGNTAVIGNEQDAHLQEDLKTVMITIGYVKKVEEIIELLSTNYLLQVWCDFKVINITNPSSALMMLEILRRNLYQLRQRVSIIDALLERPTGPLIPKATKIHTVRSEYTEENLVTMLTRLCETKLLQFTSQLSTSAVRTYQSVTMRNWAMHLRNIPPETRNKMNILEGKLFNGTVCDQVNVDMPWYGFYRAFKLSALDSVAKDVKEAQKKRMDESPKHLTQDDIVLLYCYASEAEQLCVTLLDIHRGTGMERPVYEDQKWDKYRKKYSWADREESAGTRVKRVEWLSEGTPFEKLFGLKYPKAIAPGV